jgi:hypothetical protein
MCLVLRCGSWALFVSDFIKLLLVAVRRYGVERVYLLDCCRPKLLVSLNNFDCISWVSRLALRRWFDIMFFHSSFLKLFILVYLRDVTDFERIYWLKPEDCLIFTVRRSGCVSASNFATVIGIRCSLHIAAS